MVEDIKKAVTSRKFWLAVAGLITCVVNNDANGAVAVVLGYIGVQGLIDHKNAG